MGSYKDFFQRVKKEKVEECVVCKSELTFEAGLGSLARCHNKKCTMYNVPVVIKKDGNN